MTAWNVAKAKETASPNRSIHAETTAPKRVMDATTGTRTHYAERARPASGCAPGAANRLLHRVLGLRLVGVY